MQQHYYRNRPFALFSVTSMPRSILRWEIIAYNMLCVNTEICLICKSVVRFGLRAVRTLAEGQKGEDREPMGEVFSLFFREQAAARTHFRPTKAGELRCRLSYGLSCSGKAPGRWSE